MAGSTRPFTADDGSYPERGKRHITMIPAQITLDDGDLIPCIIRDLSYGGAKLGVARIHRLPLNFNLTIPCRDLTFRVDRVWQRGDFAGVKLPMVE